MIRFLPSLGGEWGVPFVDKLTLTLNGVGFLLIAGVTGCVLAWNHELEAAIRPELFRARPNSSSPQPLDPLTLRERVAARYPNASKAWTIDCFIGACLTFPARARTESRAFPEPPWHIPAERMKMRKLHIAVVTANIAILITAALHRM